MMEAVDIFLARKRLSDLGVMEQEAAKAAQAHGNQIEANKGFLKTHIYDWLQLMVGDTAKINSRQMDMVIRQVGHLASSDQAQEYNPNILILATFINTAQG